MYRNMQKSKKMDERIKLHHVNSIAEPIHLSDYCPISVKGEKNSPIKNPYDDMSNSKLFLSNKNIYNTVYYVVALGNSYKSRISKEVQRSIPDLMRKWAKNENIDDWEDLTNDATITLEFLNKKFLRAHNALFNEKNAGTNKFRVQDKITDKCGRTFTKKYDEMTAADYHTIDVWQEEETSRYNKNFRYNNTIPSWQRTMNIRHYDLSNDGLAAADSERASLDNQIHGYDMVNIIKGSTNYENYYYNNW